MKGEPVLRSCDLRSVTKPAIGVPENQPHAQPNGQARRSHTQRAQPRARCCYKAGCSVWTGLAWIVVYECWVDMATSLNTRGRQDPSATVSGPWSCYVL